MPKHLQPAERFGKNIKYLRKRPKLRISQDTLGQVMGVHQSAISRMEIGEQEPNLSQLLRASAYFRRSIHSLVAEDLEQGDAKA